VAGSQESVRTFSGSSGMQSGTLRKPDQHVQAEPVDLAVLDEAGGLTLLVLVELVAAPMAADLVRADVSPFAGPGLGLAALLALGQWDEAATVAFLFGLSESLESFSLERARRAIRRLLEVAPQAAERLEADGSTRRISASE